MSGHHAELCRAEATEQGGNGGDDFLQFSSAVCDKTTRCKGSAARERKKKKLMKFIGFLLLFFAFFIFLSLQTVFDSYVRKNETYKYLHLGSVMFISKIAMVALDFVLRTC